ncbi:MAG: NADH-quinone oxidoreductase subunit J [Pseudomonadales bacterium]|nr:NADH-quinone oxidoreductase subunit J [Pseudomonadales bacterium]MCP5332574.1 NADH-quinone oxidoreductase subunit J [Pseudomonadales bacterium]HMU89127.1 NADH-quinone oxidoreductase subunit J [Pseudomonadales bacterium]HMW14030.1 NADH-quinone oxidoreductase subunit J [Pseudomonadales bacterium]HMW82433.1 NADH-quinone oxidoreductase subunit J [Pseudomonadales bacterium]
MELAFYLSAAVALLATLGVIIARNPVHALLYLVVSLLAVAMIFFAIGAPFAGALEVIVYAGAIMVLFVFVVMMLNLGPSVTEQERLWTQPRLWIGPSLLSALLLAGLLRVILADASQLAGLESVGAKQVGIALFGPYLLAVELASLLLLGALVAAYHLGHIESDKDKK